ncbi:DUF4202 domain-containing protein [uncultured Arcticibacterium sp.]|uniref:DUF4202 domain-containing protein n=1 Tax=uncultured Arcticibacterium sp. TaxID=2173042 RepID=UPI0030F90BBB
MIDLSPAFAAFDAYNNQDPNQETIGSEKLSKETLYGLRMSIWLNRYDSEAPPQVKLAARSQHIGRWEMARNSFPMDRTGYLKWRSQLAIHHAKTAGGILTSLGYEEGLIDKVKFLLQKKQLRQNEETQLLEDVIFLVFVEHYLEDFAAKHTDEKVIDIIAKTLKKVTARAIETSASISVSERMGRLIGEAAKTL